MASQRRELRPVGPNVKCPEESCHEPYNVISLDQRLDRVYAHLCAYTKHYEGLSQGSFVPAARLAEFIRPATEQAQ